MRVHQGLAAWAAGGVACLTVGVALAQPTVLPKPSRDADAFRCTAKACAMPSEGAYPHIVMGLYQAAASSTQSQQLFHDMRAQRHWLSLPNDAAAFYATIQPVSITLPGGRSLAVLLGQDEFSILKPQPGDLVRYSSHFGIHEVPPTDPVARAYWSIDGCVALICRAQDKACFGRYRQGVFRRPDGMALSPQTFKPLPHGTVIDVDSLLPRHTAEASH